MRNEVSNTYKQYLRVGGQRVNVRVPEFFRKTGLKFFVNSKVTSVLVPLEDELKTTLGYIDSFVKENVKSEKYKPLWLKDAMCINVSSWCQYQQVNPDGSRTPITSETFLGRGHYSMLIQASHAYVGPHKGGETYSLSLHVVQITYKPVDDLMELIETLSTDFEPPPQPEPLKVVADGKKKKSRGRKAKDTLDGQNISSIV